MSVAGRERATREWTLFSHGVAAFARKNSCHAFRWRPRLDLQLSRSRKPHPSSDLEWRHWAGSAHSWFLHFDRKHNYLLQEVETQTWVVGDNPVGTWVSSRNLTYVKVLSNMFFLFGTKWILHRSLMHPIWQGTTNYMQRTT